MKDVFFVRTQFKIVDAVVGPIFVLVIHERPVGVAGEKRRGDQLMNKELLMNAAGPAKPYDAIAFEIVLLQRTLRPTAISRRAFRKRSDIAEIADLVQALESRNFFPRFAVHD